jgi:hypothetical protein
MFKKAVFYRKMSFLAVKTRLRDEKTELEVVF